MSDLQKLQINASAIHKIKDFANRRFQETGALPADARDLQIFLIIAGLEDYLKSLGITPPFSTATEPRHDGGSLDEIG